MCCKDCGGTGSVKMQCSEITEEGRREYEMELNCVRCEGGTVEPKTFLEDTIEWCSCDDPVFGDYPLGPHGACTIPKEHVHCGNCGKVQQLG